MIQDRPSSHHCLSFRSAGASRRTGIASRVRLLFTRTQIIVRRLIFGCGYLGLRIAQLWRERGDDVWALTRSTSHAADFERMGIHSILGDVLDPDSLAGLPAADTVVYAVGYDRTAEPSKREVYVAGLGNVLAAIPEPGGRLIYISSTSVYGQSDGEWVDETSLTDPTSEGGRICLEAENRARSAADSFESISVLRLSGIYGPGRLAARLDSLHRQKPVSAPPEGWLNLIHVEDAAAVIAAVSGLDNPPETLLVSDDRPLKRREYYERLTRAIQSPPPLFLTDSIGGLGKRCANRRMHQLLRTGLMYPTLAEGLPTAIS